MKKRVRGEKEKGVDYEGKEEKLEIKIRNNIRRKEARTKNEKKENKKKQLRELFNISTAS